MYILEKFRWAYVLFVLGISALAYRYYLVEPALALIMVLSILPTIIYLSVARWTDVGAREPRGTITWGIIVGMLLIYPAIFIEQRLFPYVIYYLGLSPPTSAEQAVVFFTAFHFLVVAPVEEILKFLGFVFSTRFHKEADLPSDSIIYVLAVAGGFAIYENIVYLISYGLSRPLAINRIYEWILDTELITALFDFNASMQTIVIRNLAAVPLHLGVAVIMGGHYARFRYGLGVTKFRRTMNFVGMFLIPIVIHGTYNSVSQAIAILYGANLAITFSVTFSTILNVFAWKYSNRLRNEVNEKILNIRDN